MSSIKETIQATLEKQKKVIQEQKDASDKLAKELAEQARIEKEQSDLLKSLSPNE